MEKTKLEKYEEIQNIIEKQARNIALQVYEEKATEYGVASVPFHTHNGVDSTQIPFSSIESSENYRVLRRLSLSSDQILSLNSTPVTLVPNMGLGSLIIIENITAYLNYKGTAYTGANNLEFRYTDGSGTKVTADMINTFINSGSNAYYQAPSISTGYVPVSNKPVVVSVPVANPLTGTSPITFVIVYRIVNFNT